MTHKPNGTFADDDSLSSLSSDDDEVKAPVTRPSTDGKPVNNTSKTDVGWKLMDLMKYEPGRGLGAQAQGRLDPVAMSQQKGRRGLGLGDKLQKAKQLGGNASDYQPSLVWKEGADDYMTADADLVWSYVHWQRQGARSNVLESEETELDDAEDKKIADRLQTSVFIDPRSEAARGQPIDNMNMQVEFCSSKLVSDVLYYKNQLDDIDRFAVMDARNRANPYESIKNSIFMNRAAVKMANMDALLNGLISSCVPNDRLLYFADVCAGPGGFSEYLLWRRCGMGAELLVDTDNMMTRDVAQAPDSKPLLSAKGFGFTLTGPCDFRMNDFRAAPPECLMAHYGPKNTGDVTQPTNISSFTSWVAQNTRSTGLHLLMADGGFDVSSAHNLQEVLSKRIYLCQILVALCTLRRGGHFITKLFDVWTEFSADLVYLISHVFQEVKIVKPITSRPANSERYLVCRHLCLSGTTNGQMMAGCPPLISSAGAGVAESPLGGNFVRAVVPANGDVVTSNDAGRVHKLPSCTFKKRLTKTGSASSSFSGSGGLSAQKPAQLLPGTCGAVGRLIEHLWSVNLELAKIESAKHSINSQEVETSIKSSTKKYKSVSNGNLSSDGDDSDSEPGSAAAQETEAKPNCPVDVLRLCCVEERRSNEGFVKFIKKSNEEFAKYQAVSLAKLIAYSEDKTMQDTRQESLRNVCLERWKLPTALREKAPWPLWKMNYLLVASLQNVVKDREAQGCVPGKLADSHQRVARLPSVTPYEVRQEDFAPGGRLAVICGAAVTSDKSIEPHPITVYSRGFRDIYCTKQNGEWQPLEKIFPNHQLRIPAGTILWGLITNEYRPKTGLRKHAFMIADVAFIYGQDCCQLPYRKRMFKAQQLVDAVTYAGPCDWLLRVAPIVSLGSLASFVESLPLRTCKDQVLPTRMYSYEDETSFVATTVYLVKHLSPTWIEAVSRSTQKTYFYNQLTSESTFDPPSTAFCSYQLTEITRLPFQRDRNTTLDVPRLCDILRELNPAD